MDGIVRGPCAPINSVQILIWDQTNLWSNGAMQCNARATMQLTSCSRPIKVWLICSWCTCQLLSSPALFPSALQSYHMLHVVTFLRWIAASAEFKQNGILAVNSHLLGADSTAAFAAPTGTTAASPGSFPPGRRIRIDHRQDTDTSPSSAVDPTAVDTVGNESGNTVAFGRKQYRI